MPSWPRAAATGRSVTRLYVDTSALGRVLLKEPDRPAILHVSSQVLRVELLRLGLRHNLVGDAAQLISGVALIPLDAAALTDAETIEPASVATLDAIHLATATRLIQRGQISVVMTYDKQLIAGCAHHSIPVVSPA
jgi:predicted nucleic acid-binding protein